MRFRFLGMPLSAAWLAVALTGVAQAAIEDGLELSSPMENVTPYSYNGFWQDVSGNDRDVDNVNPPAYDGGGARNTAVELDGTSGTMMTLVDGDNDALDPGLDDYSVSCWVHQQSAAIAWIVDKGAFITGVEPGFSILSINGTPAFRVLGEGGGSAEQVTLQGSGTNLTTGWHHLVGVIDRTANEASLYVDGVFSTSASIPDVGGSPADIADPGQEVYLGGRGESLSYKFDGYMDDVALYRGALSAADVSTLYGASTLEVGTISTAGISPLVIHNFETTGATPGVVPDVADGHDGEVMFASQVTDATRGEVLDFSGAENAKVDYGDVLDPLGQAYTVAFWYKSDQTEGIQYIADKGNAGSDSPGWSVFLSGEDLFVRATTTVGEGSDPEKVACWKPSAANEWHHVTLVIDNENGLLQGYLDGIGSGADGAQNSWNCDGRGGASTVSFTPGELFDTDSSLLLGLSENRTAPFGGQMDDFQVWSRALSSQEILSLVSGGQPLEGDLNGDGFVGGDDLDIVRSFWGQSVESGNLLQGDPSNDGFVGGDDLDIVRANWGQGTPPAPTSVPEPTFVVLAITALLSLAFGRPRRW